MTTAMEASRADGPSGRPLYLTLGSETVLAFLHLPESRSYESTAVLFCPPFGWEDVCSYRGRRRWAEAAALAGYPALRFDLPGTGDSQGYPTDPHRLDAWTEAVTGTADWIRETTGAQRVTAIGIGLGGMVACRAVTQGAAIDDLILWGVPARGRTLVRELRAYAAVVAARYPAEIEDPPLPPEGGLEVTGFLLSGETLEALGALDLTASPIPEPERRRVLLLERDRMGVDKRLLAYFEQSGAAVTTAATGDYANLMSHPQEALTPVATITRTISWLGEPAPGPRTTVPEQEARARVRAGEKQSIELTEGGVEITERPLALESPHGSMFCVLAEAAGADSAPVCAVLLNPGTIRRIGPNRTWVEIARGWAARGVPTVRIDMDGIGDSDGDEREVMESVSLHTVDVTQRIVAALDQLVEVHGLPPRLVLVGLCSGAYQALRAALEDSRVVGVLTINLYAFELTEELIAERNRRETVAALRSDGWKRLASGRVTRQQLGKAVHGIRHGRLPTGRRHSIEASQTPGVDAALDKLRDRGAHVLIMLSSGEQLYDQFVREGRLEQLARWPNVQMERLPSTDHNCRSLWLQHLVANSVDRALDRVLESQYAHPRASSDPPATD